MKKFVFYNSLDKLQEPIDKTLADDETHAQLIFSNKKRLSIEEFNKLYKVKEEETNGCSY